MRIANNILKNSLTNVYFLTGTACGGKTTMARALCAKHGFAHFNDNWHEDTFAAWLALCDERYQPKSTKRNNDDDWEAYFSRSVEEFLAADAEAGDDEYLEYSIIELIKLSQRVTVVADVWIKDTGLLTELADRGRIACLLAPGDLIIRDYYQREDHREFYECIMRLTEPERKLATQNELFRINAKQMLADARRYGLFYIMRDDDSTVEGTLKQLEAHFGL